MTQWFYFHKKINNSKQRSLLFTVIKANINRTNDIAYSNIVKNMIKNHQRHTKSKQRNYVNFQIV